VTTQQTVTLPSGPPPSAAASEPGPREGTGLRKLLLRGSAYEMLGYGLSQVVRFGSNLLLSRLLFPEAFGLAALVNILNQGLVMLSDVGLPTVIVQSERGDDIRFLNTAFTWQAARSAGLWLVAVACAAPMAWLYGEPQLKQLVPFGALAVLIMGLRSTGYYTLRRRLHLGPIMLVEIVGQVAAVIAMLLWAQWDASVWALMVGSVASAVTTVIATHMLNVGYRNRFAWDRESARCMFDFGKWVAGSSMLTFISQQGDRLLLGQFLGAGTLGVYSIAVFLSGALGEAITRITHGVFFPAYSRVRNDGIERLKQVFYRTRLAIDSLVMTALGGLCVLGPAVVHILYDRRYADAGWMLRVLSIRVAIAALSAPYQFCLFAVGQSHYGFFLNLARTIALIGGVPLGYKLDGIAGLLWGVTFSEVPALLVAYVGFSREGLASPWHELRVPAFFALGTLLGYAGLIALTRLGWHI